MMHVMKKISRIFGISSTILVLIVLLTLSLAGLITSCVSDNGAATAVGKGSKVAWVVAAKDSSAEFSAQADWVCDGIADNVEINKALAKGGKIVLCEGNYSLAGPVDFSKPNITLSGIGKVLLSLGAGFASPAHGYVVEIYGKNNCTLENINIDLGHTGFLGISVYSSDKTTVRNVEVYADGVAGGGSGITIYASDSSTFLDCYVHHLAAEAASGYNCKGTTHVIFERCTASNLVDTSRAGWEIEDSNEDLLLLACKSRNNAGMGIDMHQHTGQQKRIRFIECEIESNGTAGFALQGEAGDAANPILDLEIRGCIIRNNGGTPVLFKNVSRVRVDSCYIEMKEGVQAWAIDGDHIDEIVNNIATLTSSSQGFAQSGTLVSGNLVYGATSYRVIYYPSNASIVNNYLSTGSIAPHEGVGVQNVFISNNRLGDGNVSLDGVTNSAVVNNSIYGQVNLKNASHCLIKGNIIGKSGDICGVTWGNVVGNNNIIAGNIFRDVQYAFTDGRTTDSIIVDNDYGRVTVKPFYWEQPDNKVYDVEVETILDVRAEDISYIHSAIAGTGADREISSGITSPDKCRNVTITTTKVASPSGDVVITGIDARGYETQDKVKIVAGSTAHGVVAFAKVTKLMIPAGVSAADSVSVGVGSKLGLTGAIVHPGDVFKVSKNNGDYSGTGKVMVNAIYDTVDVSTGGAIVTGDDFTIWYRLDRNMAN